MEEELDNSQSIIENLVLNKDIEGLMDFKNRLMESKKENYYYLLSQNKKLFVFDWEKPYTKESIDILYYFGYKFDPEDDELYLYQYIPTKKILYTWNRKKVMIEEPYPNPTYNQMFDIYTPEIIELMYYIYTHPKCPKYTFNEEHRKFISGVVYLYDLDKIKRLFEKHYIGYSFAFHAKPLSERPFYDQVPLAAISENKQVREYLINRDGYDRFYLYHTNYTVEKIYVLTNSAKRKKKRII